MQNFKRIALITLTVFTLHLPALAQDTPTPEQPPTETVIPSETPIPTETTIPTETPIPPPPPPDEPPVEDPAPPLPLTSVILSIVSIAALWIIGAQSKRLQEFANALLNAPPQWIVELVLEFANRGFDEAARRAGETETPLDDEAIRKLREEFNRIVEEARKQTALLNQAIANAQSAQKYNPPS